MATADDMSAATAEVVGGPEPASQADIRRPLRTAIVGRGRVGGALAVLLGSHRAFEVVAGPLGRDADLGPLAGTADLVLLAVSDAAVPVAAQAISPCDGTLLVHFAGSLTLDALAPHRRRASLHPLSPIPPDRALAVERLRGSWMALAGDPLVAEVAEALDGRTFSVGEHHRATYHATATVAASHVAALLGQVERLAGSIGVPFDAYLELSAATLRNVAALGACDAFTGPMARQDWATLRRHLAALPSAEHPAYLAMARESARLLGLDLPDDLDGPTLRSAGE